MHKIAKRHYKLVFFWSMKESVGQRHGETISDYCLWRYKFWGADNNMYLTNSETIRGPVPCVPHTKIKWKLVYIVIAFLEIKSTDTKTKLSATISNAIISNLMI